MSFGEAKVYFDGSHYIAIPHTERPSKKRKNIIEKQITVVENISENKIIDTNTETEIFEVCSKDDNCEDSENNEKLNKNLKNYQKIEEKTQKITKKLTKKEFFNELYQKFIELPKKERKEIIIKNMLPYFSNLNFCIDFVNENFARKQRNLICRRIRMVRKINQMNFNYFCTFTYDDKKHTEESFKKKLRTCFRHLCERKSWKYIGVWERAPETKRLHFHGVFYIPNGTIPGELFEKNDYNFNTHKMQTTIQNSYFNNRFGRSDFEPILDRQKLGSATQYLMKYIEKTGEKIVYSKGLYQYFITDIMDEDVVCLIGQDDQKLLLFDDFNCWDEGCLIGKVGPETIMQLRKSN